MPPTETTESTPRVTKHRIFFACIVGFVLLATGAYFFSTKGEVSTEDAQIDGRLVPVAPKITGYISELLVDDNQTVNAGQTLARIDSRDLQVRVDQAEAALSNATAQANAASKDVPLTSGQTSGAVAEAQASVAASQAELIRAQAATEKAHHADMSVAQASIAEREASFENARADLQSMQQLATKHEISRLQLDRYIANEHVAASQLDAARQTLAAQSNVAAIGDAGVSAAQAKLAQAHAQLRVAQANGQQVGIRGSDADAKQADVKAAQANLEQAKLQLSYTDLIAPQAGRVTRRTVEAGAYVQPGQTLLTLVPSQDIWVTANFKETQLKSVRAGDQADIKVDLLGVTLRGTVDSISGATGTRMSLLPPENATGNYVKIVQRIPVKIKLDPSVALSSGLSVGANVDVTIHTR